MTTRVLQVNKLYHPHVGGVESVVRTLAAGLDDRGYGTSVLCAVERGHGSRGTVDGVPVRRVSSLGTVRSVPLAPTFPAWAWHGRRDADIVHHHVPNPLGTASELLVPEGPTTVATYHSDIVRQSMALRVYEPVLEAFLSGLDRILVTSPRLLESSPHLDGRRGKCTVVPPGIDLGRFGGPTRELDAERPGIGPLDDLPVPDEPFVLCVGRLNYYKGVEHLVDAMRSVTVPLVVVGEGPRREALEQRARTHGIAGRVRFVGHVDEAALHALYERASVFVLPSVEPSEAFGIVQLEAMAHRTPVVNTDLPTGVPWVSQDGETGLTVPPRDAPALAAAVSTLLGDDERRAAYGRAARERVEQHFTIERMLDDVAAVYEDCR